MFVLQRCPQAGYVAVVDSVELGPEKLRRPEEKVAEVQQLSVVPPLLKSVLVGLSAPQGQQGKRPPLVQFAHAHAADLRPCPGLVPAVFPKCPYCHASSQQLGQVASEWQAQEPENSYQLAEGRWRLA